ncbi:MAG: VPLPA-CTERM sorting domain-containing protein [Proteobacteria bacterium]|nr:VPLPA-CTERM sorting domain-containing protein [Pseudomonadota bacterium]
MDQAWKAVVDGKTVYSNGVTFQVQDWDPTIKDKHGKTVGGYAAGSTPFTLYGFCVDITHEISVGNLSNQNLIYNDNEDPSITDPLPTDFHGNDISVTQLAALTDLIDTGYQLHESETGHAANSDYVLNVELQLAAIQAAIWTVENPGAHISLVSGNSYSKAAGTNKKTGNYGGVIDGTTSLTYQQYYDDFVSGNYNSLADDNDKFYTIVEVSPKYDGNQAFAIGWPIAGIPEPATWAMLLTGFGGLGAMLRGRRQRAALA